MLRAICAICFCECRRPFLGLGRSASIGTHSTRDALTRSVRPADKELSPDAVITPSVIVIRRDVRRWLEKRVRQEIQSIREQLPGHATRCIALRLVSDRQL